MPTTKSSIEGVSVGDLHLDRLKKLYPDNHIELQLAEVDKAVEYARKQGVAFLVFLGDIAEHPVLSPEAFNALLRRLKSWEKYVELHMFLGNHDFSEVGVHSLVGLKLLEEFGFFSNTHVHVKPRVIKRGGLDFNFRPYPAKKSVPGALNFGHFETAGSVRDNGQPTRSREKVKGHWQMGHLHTPHKAGNVAYAGTLYQLNFGESLPKGFGHFRWDGSIQQTRFIKNDPAFKLINVVVETTKDLKKIDRNPLHRFRLIVRATIDLDDSFLSDHPTVVKIEGYKSKSELTAIMEDNFLTFEQQALNEFSVLDGLQEFIGKTLTPTQVTRGMEIIQELKSEISTTKVG